MLGSWLTAGRGVTSLRFLVKTGASCRRLWAIPTSRMDLHVSEDETEAHITLPGYTYGDVNRAALKNLLEMVELLTSCRQFAWDKGFLDMRTRLRMSGHTFLVGMTCDFPQLDSSRLHQEPACPSGSQHDHAHETSVQQNQILQEGEPHSASDYVVTIRLNGIGQSSFTTISTLKTRSSNTSLVEQILFWVYTDKTNRKKASLPEWFTEKYKPKMTSIKQDRPLKLIPPDRCHQQAWTVQEKHIDHFGHANNTVYVKSMIDTLIEAQEHGYYSETDQFSFKFDIRDADLQNCSFLFSGEGRLGDEVVTKVWHAEEKNANTLYAQTVKNEMPIVHAAFTLHKPYFSKL